MLNGASDNTFTEMRHLTVATQKVFEKPLLKRTKKEIEEKSYPAHSENLSASQLATIAAIDSAQCYQQQKCNTSNKNQSSSNVLDLFKPLVADSVLPFVIQTIH